MLSSGEMDENVDISAFERQFPFVRTFRAANPSACAAHLVAALAKGWHAFCAEHPTAGVWCEAGFLVGGVFGAAYVPFVLEAFRRERLDRLLFVARDGYLLEKMARLADPSVQTLYVYTPRSARVERRTAEDRSAYERYVEQLGIRSQRCASVDLGTQSFSSQKVLNAYLDTPVHAIFSETSVPVPGGSSFLLAPNETPAWSNLLEYVFSAPHATVVAVRDGKPVYGPCNELERDKLSHQGDVEAGALAGFAALHEAGVQVGVELWLDWIEAMLYDRPRAEIRRWRQLRVDLGHHGKYYPAVADDLTWRTAWPSKALPLVVTRTVRKGLRLTVTRRLLGLFKLDEREQDL